MKKGCPFKSSALTVETPVIDHSKEFFAYKTYAKNYLIQLNGMNLWLKHDDAFLLIGDLETGSEDEFEQTIKRLKRLDFFLGLPHLRFQTSTSTEESDSFRNMASQWKSIIPSVVLIFQGKSH